MTVRRTAIFLSIVAISLFASLFSIHSYNRPNPAIEVCFNDGSPPDQIIVACSELIETPAVSEENLAYLLLNRSKAFREKSDYDSAIADLDRALALKPDYTYVWLHKAYNHISAGDKTAADSAFEAALALNPDSVWPLTQRAKLYYCEGYYEQALQDYKRIFELDPTNDKAIRRIVQIYVNLEEFQLAIDAINAMIIDWPDRSADQQIFGYLYLGLLHYLYSEDYQLALNAFSRSAELDPDAEVNLLFIGATHFKLGNENLGKEYIENYADLLDQNQFADRGLIHGALLKLGDNLLFKGANLLQYRGLAYAQAGQADLARAEFENYLDVGGEPAAKTLRLVLSRYGFYDADTALKNTPEEFDDPLERYVESQGKIFSLETLVNGRK